MQIIIYFLCVLLLLKIIYNLTIPYTLLRSKNSKKGISFMPYLEFFLLVIAVILALFVDNTNILFNAGKLILIGIGLIVASYLHFVIVMMIGGWIISKKGKGRVRI